MEKTVFRTTLPRAECERALDAALETERTDFEHGGRYRAESPVTGWVMGRLFRLALLILLALYLVIKLAVRSAMKEALRELAKELAQKLWQEDANRPQ